ncbi:MAG TPA: IS630 family transposase [Dehalococcoidia bacterium]|jgi:transposase
MGKASLSLSEDERVELRRLTLARNLPQKVVLRARIVLLTADGVPSSEIVERLGTTYPTISLWRRYYREGGLGRLCRDAARSGRPARISTEQVSNVVERTLHSTPVNSTHWSTRKMAQVTGLSKATIQRLWKQHGLQPHRQETFKLSRDPQFLAKLQDVVGLYLDPPEKAIVFSVDEKSQIQALERTQPGLPLKKGRAGTMTHDYKRHGTTTLFAALNVVTGEVVGECYDRHRHHEFLAFLKKLDRQAPKELDLHLILDNYATHKHAEVQAWLTKHSRVHLHFTPTSASWLNLVERFFAEITQNRIRRGVFKSVAELEAAITAYLAHRNQKPRPFTWTASVERIVERVSRAKSTLETSH